MNVRKLPISLALACALGLAACDDNGEFALPSASSGGEVAPLPANALNQRVQVGRDIERPDIFEVTDSGLWDGRPSLGGVWVAHPDVLDPDRVVIRNSENGRSIVGALFRRERENPGPLLQVSSDAADALGILPGSPTDLNVVVLRREEVEVEAAPEVEANPVVASLEAPVSIEAAPLDPVDGADDTVASDVAVVAAPAVAAVVVLSPAVEAATAAVEQTAQAAADVADTAADTTSEAIDVSAVLAPAPANAPADGPLALIGIFSVEANANSSAQTIIAAGIEAAVLPEEIGGRTVWRVVAGPLVDADAVAQLKALGFVDAFIVEAEE